MKTFKLVMCAITLFALFAFFGTVRAMDVGDYNTVTLTKSSDPAPYCPATKISDNDRCMSCHTMMMENGKPKFGLMEIPLSANFSERPSVLDIVQEGDEVVGRVEIGGTGGYALRAIADYYYTRPELKTLIMELQTPGGSVMDAWKAVGVIREMQSRGIVIKVRCYGIAASAGVILLVAVDIGVRTVSELAEVMMHLVWTFTMFDLKTPDTAEDQAATLKHLQENINKFLLSRSKMTKEQLNECIYKKDYWMTGAEAVKFGLADKML